MYVLAVWANIPALSVGYAWALQSGGELEAAEANRYVENRIEKRHKKEMSSLLCNSSVVRARASEAHCNHSAGPPLARRR